MLRLAGLLAFLLAFPDIAEAQVLTRADTLAIKRLAAEAGIDTAKAQVKVKGDTAWVSHRRDPTYGIGMELRRQNGLWVPHMTADSTSVAPLPTPLPRRPLAQPEISSEDTVGARPRRPR